MALTAAERAKRYRERHPERVRAADARRHEANADKVRERVRRWREDHLEERLAYEREYREQNRTILADRERARRQRPESRARSRLRKYGISPGDYEEMYAKQNGVCLICGRPPGSRSLHVDHDHATGAVRGLLCGNCNQGLGNFQDDPAVAIAAAMYLILATEA